MLVSASDRMNRCLCSDGSVQCLCHAFRGVWTRDPVRSPLLP